eukprot:596717-Alexandrium_andersonii.AAC.1
MGYLLRLQQHPLASTWWGAWKRNPPIAHAFLFRASNVVHRSWPTATVVEISDTCTFERAMASWLVASPLKTTTARCLPPRPGASSDETTAPSPRRAAIVSARNASALNSCAVCARCS